MLIRLTRTPVVLGVCAQDPELDIHLDRAAARALGVTRKTIHKWLRA